MIYFEWNYNENQQCEDLRQCHILGLIIIIVIVVVLWNQDFEVDEPWFTWFAMIYSGITRTKDSDLFLEETNNIEEYEQYVLTKLKIQQSG